MLTILVDEISERLNYTLSLIFDDRGIAWQLITEVEEFQQASQPKMVYGNSYSLRDALHLPASSLLFEDIIREISVGKSVWENIEVLEFEGVPDVLASVFYVASLYDDYLQEEVDAHGRNIGKNSLLYRYDWHEKLLVERWSEAIIYFLEAAGVSLSPKKLPFSYIPTFDIDNAYAYKLKKGWRKWLSIARDYLYGNKQRLQERKQVLQGQKRDPYDTFETILHLAEKHPETRVFWLLGDYGKFDKNIHPSNAEFQALIKEVSQHAQVGLHPSYASNDSFEQVIKEKKCLEDIVGTEVKSTRQHFLKVHLPTTFKRLEKAGFTDDYSLAYADVAGFRAGISRPFLWFDLNENRISTLRLHPITYMDGTLNEYMNLSISEAKEKVRILYQEVERYGGEMIALWHNETIGNYGKWKGWKEVLEMI